jgi:EpsI family protein
MRQPVALAAALGLLVTAGALVRLPAAGGVAPVAGALWSVPVALGAWVETDDPPPGILAPDPGAAARLRRAYRRGARTLWVAVDYYPDQREGHRPQSLQLLYPGGGWSDLRAARARVALSGPAGSLPITRVTLRRGAERLVVAYWYQVGPRASASEHWYRALVLWNRLAGGRPESALVRVASPLDAPEDDADVVGEQDQFIQVFYPELRRGLSGEVGGREPA